MGQSLRAGKSPKEIKAQGVEASLSTIQRIQRELAEQVQPEAEAEDTEVAETGESRAQSAVSFEANRREPESSTSTVNPVEEQESEADSTDNAGHVADDAVDGSDEVTGFNEVMADFDAAADGLARLLAELPTDQQEAMAEAILVLIKAATQLTAGLEEEAVDRLQMRFNRLSVHAETPMHPVPEGPVVHQAP